MRRSADRSSLRSARPGAVKFATGSSLALIGRRRLLGCSFTVRKLECSRQALIATEHVSME